MNSDDFAKRIMEAIVGLPIEERCEAILSLLSEMLPNMPVDAVQGMRAEILAQFEADIPIIEQAINLIDGHLILRELGPLE